MSTTDAGRADAETGPVRGRGRRPAAEVRSEVLAATGTLLFEQGIDAVTFDRVAAASGASKTTLYRWWPSPGALAAEAYFATVETELAFVDTGDIRHDLEVQLHAFARVLGSAGAGSAIRELIGAAQTDPELRRALVAAYSRPRRAEAVVVIDAAKARGQIRADLSPDVLVDQLWGACYHRLLLLDEPVDDALVDAVLDNALRGASPR